MSAASARSAASRAAIPSSASRIASMSAMSRSLGAFTEAPRRGSMTTRPTCSNRRSASRTGDRLVRNRLAMSGSDSR
ncbi:hypothetical protein RHODGE_RHODGE_00987 [Rhodoplanes serenus]|uniref:Uncharacterized protein n=1 Tax=Rhodoplanes serenus TaxID=200615 RepID=A0A447CRS6_9BRAD|nr:hypothetical protein RHODGE_RHODGE_00987 [Rhodoplanes serenus]